MSPARVSNEAWPEKMSNRRLRIVGVLPLGAAVCGHSIAWLVLNVANVVARVQIPMSALLAKPTLQRRRRREVRKRAEGERLRDLAAVRAEGLVPVGTRRQIPMSALWEGAWGNPRRVSPASARGIFPRLHASLGEPRRGLPKPLPKQEYSSSANEAGLKILSLRGSSVQIRPPASLALACVSTRAQLSATAAGNRTAKHAP